jgi:hypothetical protein
MHGSAGFPRFHETLNRKARKGREASLPDLLHRMTPIMLCTN